MERFLAWVWLSIVAVILVYLLSQMPMDVWIGVGSIIGTILFVGLTIWSSLVIFDG